MTMLNYAKSFLPGSNLPWRSSQDYTPNEEKQADQEDTASKQKRLLYTRMETALSRRDWETAATELDGIEGNNRWKARLESAYYDHGLIEDRLRQLDIARASHDLGRMLFLIRTSLSRNLGDMGNERLYKHSHVGTKNLIERYINSALSTLQSIVEVSENVDHGGTIKPREILEQVLFARQAFGRSALLLSGGANFGMSHTGVVKALWEADLLPQVISGASAGSIICSVLCTTNDRNIPNLLSTFCDGDFAVFGDDEGEDGLLRKAARFLKHGAVFDINHLTRVMRDMLGDITFQEAYNRTRKILNICVSSASLYELPRLLNYVTAPNVLIWSAVAASCSVPLLYNAASILAKDPVTGEAHPWDPTPQRYIDGSVDNDIPTTRLAEMFNVNHFIVSQVNPHVVPFIMKEEKAIDSIGEDDADGDCVRKRTWIENASHLAKGEALHRMHTLSELGVFPNLLSKAVSILSQKYSGDITILPKISYADFPHMLSNPTRAFVRSSMLAGERATWPKLSIVKNHCAIELALDNAVQRLRAQVVFDEDKGVPARQDHPMSRGWEAEMQQVNKTRNFGKRRSSSPSGVRQIIQEKLDPTNLPCKLYSSLSEGYGGSETEYKMDGQVLDAHSRKDPRHIKSSMQLRTRHSKDSIKLRNSIFGNDKISGLEEEPGACGQGVPCEESPWPSSPAIPKTRPLLHIPTPDDRLGKDRADSQNLTDFEVNGSNTLNHKSSPKSHPRAQSLRSFSLTNESSAPFSVRTPTRLFQEQQSPSTGSGTEG